MTKKAYSYSRFSSMGQATGTSEERQQGSIIKICEQKGWELVGEYLDRGKSAYKGKHLDGQLGQFLNDCASGVVEKGSILVVESIDRITRLGHLEASELMRDLIKHVEIFVIESNLHITLDSFNQELNTILSVDMFMHAAGAYSRRLSQRLKESYRLKEANKELMPGKFPCWLKRLRLKRDGKDGWEKIDWKIDIIKKIVEMRLKGLGVTRICAELNAGKTPLISRARKWNKAFIKNLVQSPAIRGGLTKYHIVNGKRVIARIVDNYYPEIVTKEVWDKINYRIIYSVKGRPARINPFFGLLNCASCGNPLHSKSMRKFQYVFCSFGNGKAGCSQTSYYNLSQLKTAFLLFNSNYMETTKETDSSGLKADLEKALERQAYFDKLLGDNDLDIVKRATEQLKKVNLRIKELSNQIEQIDASNKGLLDIPNSIRLLKENMESNVDLANSFIKRYYKDMKFDLQKGELEITKLNGNRYKLLLEMGSRGSRELKPPLIGVEVL